MPGPRHHRSVTSASTVGLAVCATLAACAALSGCGSPSAAPPVTVPRIAATRLLAVGDLPAGWSVDATAFPTGSPVPCSAPPPPSAVVGASGRGVAFSGPGGSPLLVEYAVDTTHVTAAYDTAIRSVQLPTTCAETVHGRTESTTFDEVLPLPTSGDGSVAMLTTADSGGTLSQTGYVVARSVDRIVVVGYRDGPTLDRSALQSMTARALSALGH